MQDADVIVVGLGTAGAALAHHAARKGLSVIGLERRALDQAGARWINGVARWMFAEAAIDAPEAPELAGGGHAFHMLLGRGPERVVVRDHEMLEVDMRHLVARLQRLARESGAELREGVTVLGLEGQTVVTSSGRFRGRTVVDASGVAGPGLLGRTRPRASDLCVAAQEVRELVDERGAEEFFGAHDARMGETVCFTAVAGGYSIVNVRVSEGTVSLLTGSIPGDGRPSGRKLLDDFVREQPWIGRTLFGGARSIPIDRPRVRLAEGRIALLGDSASQVFGAHGSGIGPGLVAARLLAEVLAGEPEDLHEYSARWFREYGGTVLAADVLRRFSESLTPEDLRVLLDTGLMNEVTARATMEQRTPPIGPALLSEARWRALVTRPELAARVGRLAARTPAARLLARSYPRSAGRVGAWARAAAWLLG